MKLLHNQEDSAASEDLLIFGEIASGNKTALEQFYVKYYKHLYRFGLSYEKDVFIVEEKISDVFFFIWQRRAELQVVKNPKVYVFTMTKNLLFQEKKRAKKLSFQSDFQAFENQNYAENVEERIIFTEQEENIRKALASIVNQIPVKSRRIFEMSRMDGLKYKQIAEILNISIKTVESHMSIAMRTIDQILRKKLGQH